VTANPVSARRMSAPERRESILDAAARLFAELPAEAVSMSDIVRGAGVSRPVVYDHFNTKRDLLIALIERHHEAVIGSLAALAADGRVRDEADYRLVLAGIFEHFDADPAGWRLLCDEPAVDSAVAEVQRRTRDEVLELAVVALRVPQGSLVIAEGLRNAINGLFGWSREHPEVEREELVDAAVALTWRGLGR
jgi:AcrR family transcriptional regulator